MQKSLFVLFVSTYFFHIAFAQDISALKGPRPVINLAAVPDNAFEKGTISIKFNPSVENLLKMQPDTSADGTISFGIAAVDNLNRLYHVTQAVLVFKSIMQPVAAARPAQSQSTLQFTDRHKQWGFHLWYQLKFPPGTNIKEMISRYQQLPGIIDVAEPNYLKRLISDKAPYKACAPDTIPNDTFFPQQWSYNNTGQSSGRPGSDIHLPQAWDIETGKPFVIVAVDDGGIQYNHPDLAAHMWPGIGYNFVNNTTTIDPSEHATHTSGTIGAINNNGIGVCGVAGGDGSPGSGVRLMSMEIFGPNDSTEAPDFGAPFIWSADRGAAISQNSWGYNTPGVFDQSVLDGIDYFIANGGGAIMKGGLVVFSAGNDNSEDPQYPAYYPKTIAVAATNNRDVLSYYSNFGSWVDICAPGGEQYYNGDPGGILSTTFNSSYEYLQGTSMACPHVSGVAALIISKAPGLLTADSVRSILLNQTDNIYPLNNSSFAGKLGTGRLNAYKAVQAAALIGSTITVDAKISSFITPLPGIKVCTPVFSPVVTIENLGIDTLKSAEIGMILDGITLSQVYTWAGNLAVLKEDTVTLSSISADTGTHTLRVYTFNPNGTTDGQPNNDTISITFTIQQSLPLPAAQNFLPPAAPMPPAGGWLIINPDSDSTWEKRFGIIGPGRDSTSCMMMDGSNYSVVGAIDIFSTPKIDLAGIDTVKFSFDVSYEPWASNFVDTLEVVYSPDCGVTWLPTGYKKWGLKLSTLGNQYFQDDYFPDTSANWRRDEIDIPTCGLSSSDILVGLKWTNGFGNNCFIDSINIDKVNSFQNNASVIGINAPPPVFCSTSFTPVVTIGNFGTDIISSLTINYQVDNNTINSYNWTGNLIRCATITATLNPISATYGNHILKIYTSNPNGQADQYPENDTAWQQLDIAPSDTLPVTQGFETNSFPPTGWSLLNPGNAVTWQVSSHAAKTGNQSMVVKNYNVPPAVGQFFSPIITNNTNIDSLFLSFDMAYAPGAAYPGSSSLPLDTLQIDVTTDCGATYQTVWKKWGTDLQTINDPNFGVSSEFTPNASQWQNVNVYLTPFVNASNFQVFFTSKGNHQNDLWIDNINIYPKILPALLKKQGYLVYPNPFTNTFEIHHAQAPSNLKAVQVFNSFGQLVWQNQYTGNAATEIFITPGNLASGVYAVKLTYTDKTVIQKIVKE